MNIDKLKNKYDNLSDDRLIELVNEGGFTEEAQNVLKDELTKRGLYGEEQYSAHLLNENIKNNNPKQGVKGWLLVWSIKMIFSILIFIRFVIVDIIWYMNTDYSAIISKLPKFVYIMFYHSIFIYLVMCVLLIYPFIFFRKKKITIKLTQYLLLFSIIGGGMEILLPLMLLPNKISGMVDPFIFPFILYSFIDLIWLFYFKLSERVKNTFIC